MELTKTDIGFLCKQDYSVLHTFFSVKTKMPSLQYADISNKHPSIIQNKKSPLAAPTGECVRGTLDLEKNLTNIQLLTAKFMNVTIKGGHHA